MSNQSNSNSQVSSQATTSSLIKKSTIRGAQLRRKFSISYKLMAIRKFTRVGSLRKTARQLGIHRKVLRCWVKNQVILKIFILIIKNFNLIIFY